MKKNNWSLFEKIFATVGYVTFLMFLICVLYNLLFDKIIRWLSRPFAIWTCLYVILWITIELILRKVWNKDVHFFSKREKEE